MLFNSLSFFVFLIIVLALYYSNFLNWKSKKGMLLLASYVFYGLWNPPLVILLWISTMVDWTAGNKLAVEENQRKRKMWLLLSMFVNLGFLSFFKYGDFFLANFTKYFISGMYTYFWGFYPTVGVVYKFFVIFFASIFLWSIYVLFKSLQTVSDVRRRKQIIYLWELAPAPPTHDR